MKVLVLNGSPKGNSNTMAITSAFLDGLNESQKCEVEIVPVSKKDIKPCSGCLTCWIRQDGSCEIRDDMNKLLDAIVSSDLLIWSFPLYQYGIPGPMKTLFDRTIPLLKMQMYAADGRVFHDTVVDLTKKKNVVICGCGYPYFPDNFAPLKLQMKNIFVDPCMLCISESGLVTIPDPQLQPAKDRLFSALRKAGAEYGKASVISPETLQEVEQPMLPCDMYIELVNNLVQQH